MPPEPEGGPHESRDRPSERVDGQPGAAALQALADRIRQRVRDVSGRRLLLGITGSPGSGKTTLASALAALLSRGRPEYAVCQPMDGFHLANSTLDRLGLRDRKGAIETFDGWGFVAHVDRLRTETDHLVYGPGFSRAVDEPISGQVAVGPQTGVVVIEGNYLLAEDAPWSQVHGMLDEVWFCCTPADQREARLIDRHIRHGRSLSGAIAWAREVDGRNAALIELTRGRADHIVSGVSGHIEGVASTDRASST